MLAFKFPMKDTCYRCTRHEQPLRSCPLALYQSGSKLLFCGLSSLLHPPVPRHHLARTFQHLLKTVLAVRIRLLQIILLLIKIRHFLDQSLTLILQSLLHIGNRRAHKPSNSSIRTWLFFLAVSISYPLTAQSRGGGVCVEGGEGGSKEITH